MNTHSFDSLGNETHIPQGETMLCKFDNKGVVSYINDFYLEFSGHKIEDIIGKTALELKHPDFPVTVFNHIMQYLFHKKNIHILVKDRTATGKNYWFWTDFYYKTDAQGELLDFYSYRKTAPQYINPKLIKLYDKLLKMEQYTGLEIAQNYFEGLLEEAGTDFETYTMHLQEELSKSSFPDDETDDFITGNSDRNKKKKKGFFGKLFK